jgi:hypothetical protein
MPARGAVGKQKKPRSGFGPVRGLFGVLSLVPGGCSGVRECPAPLAPAKEQQYRQYQQQPTAHASLRDIGEGLEVSLTHAANIS